MCGRGRDKRTKPREGRWTREEEGGRKEEGEREADLEAEDDEEGGRLGEGIDALDHAASVFVNHLEERT